MELIEIIIDAKTGEIEEKPYNQKQIAEFNAAKAEIEARLKSEQVENKIKEEKRKSALAKLAAIGLTEDEIAAL